MKYYQHGDVLLKPITLPTGTKKLKSRILHKGQNHAHSLVGEFELREKEGKTYLVAEKGCRATHPEHKTISIPKGVYEKSVVMEYDHFLEESREVID